MTGFTGATVLAVGLWLAVYRLPLRTPRARQRFRLAVASRTGLPARYVFPIVGTAIYLVAGLLTAMALILATSAGWRDPLPWHPDGRGIALTVLAGLGAGALTTFAMTVIYAVKPAVDIPGAIADVRWIQEILVLPRRWRWVVPMASAAVEEYVFRGVALTGLLAAGVPAWWAIGISGAVFTTGQVVLTENRLQATVLGLSSVVLSVVGGLLVVVTGSVVPAILVHASFAGYYTNAGAQRSAPELVRS
jgi:hypothetical protein